MTAAVLDLLQAVSAAGGTVRLEGSTLQLAAPKPLPEELRARLRQHKAEIVALLSTAEPANPALPKTPDPESAADLPPEIVDGVRAILSADVAGGFRHGVGHGCNTMHRGWSRAAGWNGHSRSAGPRPTCSAATAERRGTGSTVPGSSY
jgi:hypothetical protein